LVQATSTYVAPSMTVAAFGRRRIQSRSRRIPFCGEIPP